jgi:RimJ/RimL family protein N-acetyltransferase
MELRDALPASVLTERLVLRAPRLSDLDNLVTKANDWEVLEPTASLPFPYLEEHGRGFIDRFSTKPGNRSYVIADRETDDLMGVIGLYFHADRPVELGYWLGRAHWGQGFAPEAVSGLLSVAAPLGLSPVRARVLAANPASVRVLEKSGFVLVEETVSVVERHRGKPLLILEWHA